MISSPLEPQLLASRPAAAWAAGATLALVASLLGSCALLGAGEREASGPPLDIHLKNETDSTRELVIALKPLEDRARTVIERRSVAAGRSLRIALPSPNPPFLVEVRDDRSFSPWATVVEERAERGWGVGGAITSTGLSLEIGAPAGR